MNNVRYQVEYIDPTKAMAYLSKNNSNRPLNERRVLSLAKAMQKNDWEFNGDAIRFDENGTLLDGQHRLSAIIKSNATIQSMVIYGLPQKVFDTIDTGSNRSSADVLAISGEINATGLAAVARLACILEKTGNPFVASTENRPTARDIQRFIERNPLIRECVNKTIRYPWIKKYLTVSLGGLCIFATKKSSLSGYSDSFFNALNDGTKTKANCPVFLLREMLISDKVARDKMQQSYKCALVFKAFKKYAADEEVKTLRLRMTGEGAEKDFYSLPGLSLRRDGLI